MKRKIICLPLLVIFVAAVDLHSQIPQQNTDAEAQRREGEQRAEAERRLRMQNMRELDARLKGLNRPRTTVPAGPAIDKETSERIRLARRLDAADHSRYVEFLKADKTGMFKLFPDHDCITKNVVRTDGDCKNFVMASSSFSFRNRGYAHPSYHDLGFNNGEIFCNAFFAQGILVSLGDVPIEDVEPKHDPGLKFILDHQPASEPAGARSMAARLKNGIEFGGFTYTSAVRPVENTTYALRSIAYNVANSLPPVSETTSVNELRFHTLALDKRADVIIVFRIVRKGADGSLTIVWKEFDRREAPKIKFPKGEKFVDFKPDIAQAQHKAGGQ
ncbi:MAG TPA: hypothetical protein VJ781_05750 [Pyrinomonadaceae bacterium]|nr:hypothetical protein [Pyrinomonadaceae bacterium]